MAMRAAEQRARIRRRRIVAAAALVMVGLAAGYLLWLRDSGLVAVQEVEVTGISADRKAITRALERAAREMTTLHVREDELRAAVSKHPTVADLETEADFPHTLRIAVRERLPVAIADYPGGEVPISAQGYVLAGLEADRSGLPTLDLDAPPRRVRLDADGTAVAAVLAAMPRDFPERIESGRWDDLAGGVVCEPLLGPELRFGDGDRAEAKWVAAAAVLADPALGEPSYIDVSVPERPVAGPS